MRRIIVLLVGLFLLSAWMALPVGATKGTPHRVTICHATASKTNPYVRITPDVAQILGPHGHDSHAKDIIPPFNFGPGEKYAGKNWLGGEVTWDNGCHIAEETTTSSSTSTSTPPSTEPPTSTTTSTSTSTSEPTASTTTAPSDSTTTSSIVSGATGGSSSTTAPISPTAIRLAQGGPPSDLAFTGARGAMAFMAALFIAAGLALVVPFRRKRGRFGRRRDIA